MMKAGIHRIQNVNATRAPAHAQIALDLLRNALEHCHKAGACYTAARVRSAISSAKGAVRAAQYRQGRAARGRP